jgi:hypothetical protein
MPLANRVSYVFAWTVGARDRPKQKRAKEVLMLDNMLIVY